MKEIVKRRGHVEAFDERKVYGSCYAACLNAHISHQQSEKIASKVSAEVKKWAGKKKRMNSDQIFGQVIAALKKHDKDAAFMYETHRDIC